MSFFKPSVRLHEKYSNTPPYGAFLTPPPYYITMRLRSHRRARTFTHGNQDMNLRSSDLWGGLLFVCFGGTFFWLSGEYEMGTSASIGPGYLPRIASAILVCIGIALIVRSLWDRTLIQRMEWGRSAPILCASVCFGYLVPYTGLLVACACTIAIASFRQTTLAEGAVLAIISTVALSLLALALNLPVSFLPPI